MPEKGYISEIIGHLENEEQQLRVKITKARSCFLGVDFPDGQVPAHGTRFDKVHLSCDGKPLTLRSCVFEDHSSRPLRREDDPPREPGAGRLIFTDRVYDFSSLFRTGIAIEFRQKIGQLPLIWRRREEIKSSFRDFCSELVYDMQVYRSIFDDIDRSIRRDTKPNQSLIRGILIDSQYGAFRNFYDAKVEQLREQVKDFSNQDHEMHGFYFRKQMWDIIMCSEFLKRTNLKPRGYAGDSEMMCMIYENSFRGETVFHTFMHKYPLETHAAQAVRNRRAMLAKAIDELQRRHTDSGRQGPLQVLSVACGPAWELGDVIKDRSDLDRYAFTLLDQDSTALAAAAQDTRRLATALGGTISLRTVRESVRTMLRSTDLAGLLGTHNLIYALGLFDYLTHPVARAVLSKLYQLLLPGGELIIGNFHHQNPTRVYMEYWADWVLFYRNEEEMLNLVRNLPGADPKVTFEDTSSQMFLRVTRRP